MAETHMQSINRHVLHALVEDARRQTILLENFFGVPLATQRVVFELNGVIVTLGVGGDAIPPYDARPVDRVAECMHVAQ